MLEKGQLKNMGCFVCFVVKGSCVEVLGFARRWLEAALHPLPWQYT